MNIETKFKVNDLVISKYFRLKSLPEKPKYEYGQFIGYEITEVQTVTCIAGTQVFYDLRALHAIRYGDEWSIVPESDINKKFRLREDELISPPEWLAKLITNE